MDGFITVFQTSALPTVMSCCDFESNGVCNLNGNEAALVVCVRVSVRFAEYRSLA